MFRDGTIQILKAHNLGAVKFIDGDSTEYVSKELYYNVCADLKQGWGVVVRRLLGRIAVVLLSVLFLFTVLHALCALTGGSQVIVTLLALLVCAVPKLVDVYGGQGSGEDRGEARDKRAVWAKVIPDILDRHIRVDRTR